MLSAATVLVLGPSGIGKSAFHDVFRKNVARIEPHRVCDTPRDSLDIHYLSKVAHAGLLSMLADQKAKGPFGGTLDIKIYSEVVLFRVRGEDQVLFRPRDLAWRAKKIEIFGPVFWELMQLQADLDWLDEVLTGTLFVIFLNPWPQPLSQVDPASAVDPTSSEGKVLVRLLERRNEKPENIAKRVAKIGEELTAWRSIAATVAKGYCVLETTAWPYAEYTYPKLGDPRRAMWLQQARNSIVALAKRRLTSEEYELFEKLLTPETVLTGAGGEKHAFPPGRA